MLSSLRLLDVLMGLMQSHVVLHESDVTSERVNSTGIECGKVWPHMARRAYEPAHMFLLRSMTVNAFLAMHFCRYRNVPEFRGTSPNAMLDLAEDTKDYGERPEADPHQELARRGQIHVARDGADRATRATLFDRGARGQR